MWMWFIIKKNITLNILKTVYVLTDTHQYSSMSQITPYTTLLARDLSTVAIFPTELKGSSTFFSPYATIFNAPQVVLIFMPGVA